MFVYCAAPRKRTFSTFTDAKKAARWLKSHAMLVLNVRHAHGRIIINHYSK